MTFYDIAIAHLIGGSPLEKLPKRTPITECFCNIGPKPILTRLVTAESESLEYNYLLTFEKRSRLPQEHFATAGISGV
jgi:hypothetical protein